EGRRGLLVRGHAGIRERRAGAPSGADARRVAAGSDAAGRRAREHAGRELQVEGIRGQWPENAGLASGQAGVRPSRAGAAPPGGGAVVRGGPADQETRGQAIMEATLASLEGET